MHEWLIASPLVYCPFAQNNENNAKTPTQIKPKNHNPKTLEPNGCIYNHLKIFR